MKRRISLYDIISLFGRAVSALFIILILMSWAEVATQNLGPNPEYSWWNLINLAFKLFA